MQIQYPSIPDAPQRNVLVGTPNRGPVFCLRVIPACEYHWNDVYFYIFMSGIFKGWMKLVILVLLLLAPEMT